MFYRFSSELFSYEKDLSVEGDVSRLNASSPIFQNSAVESVSIMMCGFLQFKIRPPSTQTHK